MPKASGDTSSRTFGKQMNGFLYRSSLWLFLSLPAILLGIRFFRPRLMPWWALPLIVSLLGWGLVNATVFFYYEHLGEVIRDYGDNAPQELTDALVADGAKRVFALLFGWMYGLVYSVPFLIIYGAFCWIRRLMQTHKPTK
jgi:hypothetical protein